MKKIMYSMFALAMAAFTFTGCEDVPAPYDTPKEEGGGEVLPDGVLLDQDFTSSLGDFKSISASGDLAWYNDFKSAMITGYQDFDGDGQKENKAGVTYLVSPEIDLTGVESAYITMTHALNYERNDINENNSLLISKNFTGDVNTATWELLKYDTEDLNSSFTFVDKSVNLPSEYMGGKVVIALRHTCNASNSSTWEVNRLKIQKGEVEEEGGGEVLPDGVRLDQDFTNTLGDFKSISASGDLAWYNDFKSAMITGYQDFDGDGQKENKAGVTFLVSPEIDLTGVESAYITMTHALNYERNDINENNSLLISKNFTGDVNTATWELLKYDTEGLNSSFTFVDKSVNLPSEYMGGKVVIALRHTCNASNSSTWEVNRLKIQEGEVETPEQPGGEVTGNSITVDVNAFGLENATDLNTLTLTDGTTLTFEAGGNKNGPKFYTTGGGSFRMYPNNAFTIASSKKIVKVVVNCDEYNGTVYNASGDISASAGKVDVNEKVVTLSGLSETSVKITNTSTTTGAGSQIRIKSIVITYAE